jgi:tungstate transport system ATP-binding protein
VLVTHDLGQARRMADDVIFLVAGRVEERCTAERFFAGADSERAWAFVEGRIVL